MSNPISIRCLVTEGPRHSVGAQVAKGQLNVYCDARLWLDAWPPLFLADYRLADVINSSLLTLHRDHSYQTWQCR